MDWDAIFEWTGRFTFLAVPMGGMALWFGKTYVDKWLTNRFQGQLDDLKHIQAQEIEKMKANFAEALDRTSKLHAHEFEILPTTWGLLSTAISQVQDALTVYFEVQTVHEIEDRHLATIMKADNYSDEDIEVVLAVQGAARNTAYHEARVRKITRMGTEGYAAYTNYYLSKAILIDPILRQLLTQMSEVMATAVNHDLAEIQNHQSIPHYMADKQTAYVAAVTNLRDQIRDRMFARLTDAGEPELVAGAA